MQSGAADRIIYISAVLLMLDFCSYILSVEFPYTKKKNHDMPLHL